MTARLTLRFVAVGYIAMLLLIPVTMIAINTFGGGVAAVWRALTQPDAVHAFWLTVFITAIVVPLNTVFGILAAITLVRHEFPGKSLLGAFIDLPLGVSPVVVGLALLIVYGQFGWFGSWFAAHGIQIVFAVPGMVLATMFVCLPFVAREVVPVLKEIGTEQEEAARTLGASPIQVFFRITLPSIRAGVGYGVVVATARALGEFGAVSVVSGRLVGQTETLTLYVQDQLESFNATGAYAAALVLAGLAILTLIAMNLMGRKEPV